MATMTPQGIGRSRISPWLTVHAMLFVLVTIMWWPTLFRGKSLIQGDSLVFSLPLLNFLRNFLHGGQSPLWVGQIYGGHPLFAEGQGAFAEPLNLLIAWIFPSALGSNVFHYVCMLAAGVGVIRLCRELGSSAWAAGVAALAVIFSGCWIFNQNNMTISGALLWTPWVLVTFERWLKKPNVLRALGISITGSLLVLAGYPQVEHGLAIFIVGTLIVMPFHESGRQLWKDHRRALVSTGALAVVLCVGLSAIQVLPTLELAVWSHRSGGVQLLYFNDVSAYVRGMLFPLDQRTQVAGVGSLLICMLACLYLVVRVPQRIHGYALASVLMLVLSLGPMSWSFRLLYDAHLVPGLHFFRIMQIYSSVCAIGVAVLAAFAVDGLWSWLQRNPTPRTWSPLVRVWLVAFALGWLALAFIVHVGKGLWPTLIVVVLALLSAIALITTRRGHWLPMTMFVIIVVQCAGLSMHLIRFYPAPRFPSSSIVDKWSHAAPQDRKIFVTSAAIVYGLVDTRWPQLDRQAQRALESDAGQSNLLRNDWSFSGELALELRNRKLLTQPMTDEIDGHTAASPGARLIDTLAIRYVIADRPSPAPGLQVVAYNPEYFFWILENTFARPFLQVYKNAVEESSAEDALARLSVGKTPQLVLQKDPGGASLPADSMTPGDVSDVHTALVKRRSDYYVIDVQSPFACWLFLADANYPGWQAKVDEKPTTVWTAQMLGKAVHIPAGSHRVVVAFRSESFRIGTWISLLSMLIVVAILVGHRVVHRRQ